MSTLTLVRHGQASLFAADYDRLSPVGEQQGRLLGQHWANRGVVIDLVYSGPRVRQQRSAELAGDGFRQAGGTWPQPIVIDELDEYDLDGLSNRLAPQLAAKNPDFAEQVGVYLRSATEADRMRNFQRMFETLLAHWQATESMAADVESWPKFQQRVAGAIRKIQDHTGRGQRVVLFTSGGFISCAIQHAIGMTDRKTLELNWRIRNCSLTEFVFTSDRFTLDGFNMIPHLEEPALWTYR